MHMPRTYVALVHAQSKTTELTRQGTGIYLLERVVVFRRLPAPEEIVKSCPELALSQRRVSPALSRCPGAPWHSRAWSLTASSFEIQVIKVSGCPTQVQTRQCCDHIGPAEPSAHGCPREKAREATLRAGGQLLGVAGGSSRKTWSQPSVQRSPRVPVLNLCKLKRQLHFHSVYLWKEVEYNWLVYFLLHCRLRVLSREQRSESVRNGSGMFWTDLSVWGATSWRMSPKSF